MKNILVVGSINMDLVNEVHSYPDVGETIIGKNFFKNPGGKGANQAVAIGKLNGKCNFLGAVGNDEYGRKLIDALGKYNVSTENILKVESETGMAIVIVDSKGKNKIIVNPGANSLLTEKVIEENRNLIEKNEIIISQLEIPEITVQKLFEIAKKENKITILNPAPATELNEEIYKQTDILIPNETELALLSSRELSDLESIYRAGETLLKKGVKSLIVTLGENGCVYMNKENRNHFPTSKIQAIDTTAAGDSFIGGFVTALSEGKDIEECINFAQKTAAITVTRRGAQESIPFRNEVM